MDPYLERHWLDVHASLVFLAKVAVQKQLSDDLVARSEERLIVEDSGVTRRVQHPDVRVVEHRQSGDPVRPAGGTAVAEPLILELEDEPIRQGNVEIIDVSSGGRVVTVIEFLSPTNKLAGEGRMKYKRKQEECFAAGVNLVEVDLTREGDRSILISPWHLPLVHRTTYLGCVYRAASKGIGRKEAYRMPLGERLPAISIPLRERDADIVLDVQSLVDQAYESGRYDRTIDYGVPCVPPLNGAEEHWTVDLLRTAGRRE
jgi:hypothetical protein